MVAVIRNYAAVLPLNDHFAVLNTFSSHNSTLFPLFSHHRTFLQGTFRTRSAMLSLRETCLKTKNTRKDQSVTRSLPGATPETARRQEAADPETAARGIYNFLNYASMWEEIVQCVPIGTLSPNDPKDCLRSVPHFGQRQSALITSHSSLS